MHGVMRFVCRGLFAAVALAGLGLVAIPDEARADSAGCTAVNGFSLSFNAGDAPGPVLTPSGTYAAGDSVRITLTLGAGVVLTDFGILPPGGGAPLSISGNPNTTTVLVFTVPAAVTGSFEINASGPAGSAGTLSFACGTTAGGSNRVNAAQQNAMNAQVATANGQQVLQQSNDAIKLGILSSFAAGSSSQMAQARLADRAKVETLANEATDLARQLADLPAAAGDEKRRELEQRLAFTQRNLTLARDSLASARPMSTPVDGALDRPADGEERKSASAPTAMRVTGSQLAADFCVADCQAPDPSTTRWNGWFDGRFLGANDSVAQQSAFGFVGVGGVDYKVMPWMTVGLSVGTEAFNNKFNGNGGYVSTNGVSVAPYVGVRLDPNIFLSAFVGGTHLNYSTAPQPGQAGQFEAWRFMAGGSLTGVWRMGPWRLQPSVDITYGSETQNGFTDSVGTVVPSQVVTYGRLRGGPEIGYRFDFADRGWSLEPFVLARGNLDFATNNASFVNGQMVNLRGQGSGGVGAGFVVQGRGFNVRGDVAYDSIGLGGFDLWTGRLRAGWSF